MIWASRARRKLKIPERRLGCLFVADIRPPGLANTIEKVVQEAHKGHISWLVLPERALLEWWLLSTAPRREWRLGLASWWLTSSALRCACSQPTSGTKLLKERRKSRRKALTPNLAAHDANSSPREAHTVARLDAMSHVLSLFRRCSFSTAFKIFSRTLIWTNRPQLIRKIAPETYNWSSNMISVMFFGRVVPSLSSEV